MAIFAGKAGSVFSNTLHTGGAIALLAGLAIYIAWARGARRGDGHPGLLKAGMVTTYLAILTNLFGGFIRTYAPGHPGFTEAFDEPWAMVMAIKHLFLFAGMFAAVYLYEVVAPRIRRALDAETSMPPSRPEGLAVGAVAVAILVATVLGAVSAVTPIGSMAETGSANEPTTTIADPNGVLLEDGYYNATGFLTSLPPLQPATSEGPFRVPANTGRLEATLTWTDQVATLDLALDQSAQRTAGTRQVVLIMDDPPAGDMRYTVSGQNAVNVAWELSIRLSPSDGGQTLLTDTVTIAPGSSVNLFEINTQMELHANASWTWQVLDGAEAAFNVHTHFDGEVQYLVEETAGAGEGRITAHRTGGYSWMWENNGPAPIRVEYRLWGQYELDSYFPPQSTSSRLLG